MIYPNVFPKHRFEKAEEKVFNAFRSQLSDKDYDVFYHQKFIRRVPGEKSEYEIDFLVADLRGEQFNGLLCIEVKGGIIEYKGSGQWIQNGKILNEDVDEQASSALHSLSKRYSQFFKNISYGWALCFPDGKCPSASELPNNLTEEMIIDSYKVNYLDIVIRDLFNSIKHIYNNKKGISLVEYNKLKESLLRVTGFIIPLNASIRRDEQSFLELTQKQLELFRLVQANSNLLIKGPAGSGKTIIAKTVAQEFEEQGQKVLYMCFNRVLSNHVRYSLGRDSNIECFSYHSFARRKIYEVDPDWWGKNKDAEDFWELEIPVKLSEILMNFTPDYDVVIVDEGQDFKELWYETIEHFLKPEGRYYVFMDEYQDIFNKYSRIPTDRVFTDFVLEENCRNTKRIIEKLEGYIESHIKYKEGIPEGQPVQIIHYKNDTEQQTLILNELKHLIKDKGINPEQILLMFNTDKRSSCLANVVKVDRLKLEAVNRKSGNLNNKTINYTSINTFKGLEADIVFIIDTDKVDSIDSKVIYTQASRAKHLLYVFLKN